MTTFQFFFNQYYGGPKYPPPSTKKNQVVYDDVHYIGLLIIDEVHPKIEIYYIVERIPWFFKYRYL